MKLLLMFSTILSLNPAFAEMDYTVGDPSGNSSSSVSLCLFEKPEFHLKYQS